MHYLAICRHTPHHAPTLNPEDWLEFMQDEADFVQENLANGRRKYGFWAVGGDWKITFALIDCKDHNEAWEYCRNFPGTKRGCGNHWELVPLVENDWYFEKVIEEAVHDRETGMDKKKMSPLG